MPLRTEISKLHGYYLSRKKESIMSFVYRTAIIVNGDSLQDMKEQPPISQDLIFCDPLFSVQADELISWIDQAVRILRPGGNLVVMHFSHIADEIHYKIRERIDAGTPTGNGQSYKNLRPRLPVLIQSNSSRRLTDDFASEAISLKIYSKGHLNRKFYAGGRLQPGKLSYSAEALDAVTNCWVEKRHHAGKIRKGIDGLKQVIHPCSCPPWVIERILFSFARKGDKVYDCFGGAGTLPCLCVEYGIECRSVEIDKDYYNHICDSLTQTKRNKTFAAYSVKLLEKATNSGSKDRKNNRLGTCLQRGISNSRKKAIKK